MAEYVCNGAMMKCSMGLAPSTLMIMPVCRILLSNNPMANIMDHQPMLNILPFGMCQSLANPVVAAATSAAMGVLTPMPCIPFTMSPWMPGKSNVLVAKLPALTKSCSLMCAWAGVISIQMPGQFTVE